MCEYAYLRSFGRSLRTNTNAASPNRTQSYKGSSIIISLMSLTSLCKTLATEGGREGKLPQICSPKPPLI